MRAASIRFSAIIEKFLMLTIFIFISVGASIAQTQSATADLAGSVVDPNGANVPGVTVSARNLATGHTRDVTSADGNFKLLALTPGEYEVVATAPSFKK